MIPIYKKLKIKDELELHLKIWENGSPLWIVHVHGIGEHTERHNFLYELFSEDFNICSFDLRGHGKSSGERVSVESFGDFREDVTEVIRYLMKDYNLNSYILMGHSMGGLVVTSFLKHKSLDLLDPKMVFLSSPAFGQAGFMGKLINKVPGGFFKKLASLKSGLTIKGVLDLKKLSHNIDVYVDYVNDKLNSLGASSKLLLKIVHEGREIKKSFSKGSYPMYGAVGSADVLVCPREVENFFARHSNIDNLEVIENGYHELHNEIAVYKDPYFEFLRKTFLSLRYENYESSK